MQGMEKGTDWAVLCRTGRRRFTKQAALAFGAVALFNKVGDGGQSIDLRWGLMRESVERRNIVKYVIVM